MWNFPYMLMSFVVLLSIWWSSSFVHSIIPALCQTAETGQILIAWNTFPAFSFNLRADLTYLNHSFLTLLFIFFSWKILLSPWCLSIYCYDHLFCLLLSHFQLLFPQILCLYALARSHTYQSWASYLYHLLQYISSI